MNTIIENILRGLEGFLKKIFGPSLNTTIAGVIVILAAVFGLLGELITTGAVADYGKYVTLGAVGYGLIKARDNKVSSEEAGAKK